MEFTGYGGHKGYARLALGTAPMLVAWGTLGLEPMTALMIQWAGFTGLWYADSRVTMMGWGETLHYLSHRRDADSASAPKWYSQYRFYLSILVGTWCAIESIEGLRSHTNTFV